MELLPTQEEGDGFVDRAVNQKGHESLPLGYLSHIENEGLQQYLLTRKCESDLIVATTGSIRNLRTKVNSGKNALSIEDIKGLLKRIHKPDEVYLDTKPENILLVWNGEADRNRVILQLDYKRHKEIYNAIRSGQKFDNDSFSVYIVGKTRL